MHCTNCSESISELAEVCPKCGVRQHEVKKYCYNCGESVNEIQELCTSCGVTLKKNKSVFSDDNMHPVIPALLSFLLTGLGQIINGQVMKGIVFFVVSVLAGIVTFGLSIFVTAPVAIIDAYLIAKKRKEGKQVEEWEFF